MGGMEVVGVGLTVAGAFLNAKNQRLQGRAQRNALQYKAQQQRAQAEYVNIQEKTAEAGQRDTLATSLEQISALQAGRGVGMASPTVGAINENIVDRAERDIASNKLTFEAKKDALRSGAQLAEQEGELAVKAGDRAAFATMLGAGSQLFNLYNYGRAQRSIL